MISAIKKVFRRSWLSCERYAERASRRLDSSLNIKDEVGYHFHHFLCHTCRHVVQHWVKMQRQLKEYGSEVSDLETLKLSKEKAAEILSKLEGRR